MMSGTVRIKSATYRTAGLTSRLRAHKWRVSALMPDRKKKKRAFDDFALGFLIIQQLKNQIL